MIRPVEYYRELFTEAGFEIIGESEPKAFGNDFYPQVMFALRPKRRHLAKIEK